MSADQPSKSRKLVDVGDIGITIIHKCGPFCGHSEGQEQDIDPFDPALCEANIPRQHRVLWRSIHLQVAHHQQVDPRCDSIGGSDQRAVGDMDIAPGDAVPGVAE